MTFKINTKKIQADIYFEENSTANIEKNYINESVWAALNYYNTDNNKNELSQTELNKFYSDLKKAVGEDKIFDTNEIKNFAKKIGTAPTMLLNSLRILSAEVIANSLIKEFDNTRQPNKNNLNNLLNKITPDNITEIWRYFQSGIDNKSTIGIGKTTITLCDTSLTELIADNSKNSEEIKNAYNKIYTAMKQAAKNKNISADFLTKKYENAMKNNNFKIADDALREMGARLNFQEQIKYNMNNYIKKYGYQEIDSRTIEQNDLNNTKKMANKRSLDISEEKLLGDGILNNAKTVPTDLNNKAVNNTLKALEELLKEEETREQIQSCIVKKDGMFGIYFPNKNSTFTIAEEDVFLKDSIEGSVIGDGDLTALTLAILTRAKNANIDLASNYKKTKNFIQQTFAPDLWGSDKLQIKD